MTKIIFILFLTIIFSCDNSSKKKNYEKNSTNETTSKQVSFVKGREFDNKLHLFLDFYQSMNPLEFREVAKNELKSQRLFYRDYEDHKRDESDLRFSYLLDSTSFPNSKNLSEKSDLPNDFNSNLYYPINTSKETYYANISTQYDSQELISISLFGPSFLVSVDSDIETNKRIEESKKYKEEIIRIYSLKYGKPKITKREENPLFLYENKHEQKFDKNIYTFIQGEKTIIISVQCCADFKTEIEYMLTSEYKSRKNNDQLEKNKKAEEQKKAKNKTLDEI